LCGAGTFEDASTGQCEIICDDDDDSGRRLQEVVPGGGQELLSRYLASHPQLAAMMNDALHDELQLMMTELFDVNGAPLFRQPASA